MAKGSRTAARCSCGADLADTFVCTRCADQYATHLGDIPVYLDEAVVTLSRQDRITRRNGGRSAEKPLPFSWNASVAIDTATSTMQAWICEITQANTPSNTAMLSPLGQAGFLLHHRSWVQANPLGPQCVDEVAYLAAMLRRTVDLPTQRWFAGLCSQSRLDSHRSNADCAEPLYGRFGATQVRCTACGALYTANERREWLIREAENALLPLPIIWAALGTLAGSRPPWNVVRRWPDRTGPRRLHARGVSLGGDELFQVGDVLDMVRLHSGRIRPRALAPV